MLIILYDNKSGPFTCFQLFVNFVVSSTIDFYMKFAIPLGDLNLESMLSTKPSYVEYMEIPYTNIAPRDNPLIK